MANKKFWLGMLAITLVFGMTVVGCEQERKEKDYGLSKVVITNGTTFKIGTVVFYDHGSSYYDNPDGKIIISDPISIESGQKKTYKLGSQSYNDYIYYSVKIIVNITWFSDVEVYYKGNISGLETVNLLLSGTNTDTDTLKLTWTGTDYNY